MVAELEIEVEGEIVFPGRGGLDEAVFEDGDVEFSLVEFGGEGGEDEFAEAEGRVSGVELQGTLHGQLLL